MAGLPFAHLNLRRNPFGEPAAAERAALAVVDLPDALVARVRAGGFALLLTGPPGRGKSTHLHALAARLPGAPLVRVPPEGAAPPLPAAPVLLVDELHLVPRRARSRLLARGPGLAATTHGEHAAELRRAGLAWVERPVGGLDRARLAAVVARRLAWARRGPGPTPTVGDAALDALLARRGDDLRAILDDLYEAVQRLPAPGEVPVAGVGGPARAGAPE